MKQVLTFFLLLLFCSQPSGSVSTHNREPFDYEPYHHAHYEVQQQRDHDGQNHHIENFNAMPSNDVEEANDTANDNIIDSYDEEPYRRVRSGQQDRSNYELFQHNLNDKDWNEDLEEKL